MNFKIFLGSADLVSILRQGSRSERRHQCVTEIRLASDYVLIWITGVSGLPGGLAQV